MDVRLQTAASLLEKGTLNSQSREPQVLCVFPSEQEELGGFGMEMTAYETPQMLPCFVISLPPPCLLLTELMKLQQPRSGEERGGPLGVPGV